MILQKTLSNSFELEGKGLHTGLNVHIKFNPAPADHGIRIKRTDLEGQPDIPALADYVTSTNRGTLLQRGDMQVGTIEHAMAALYAHKIDNCLIEVDAPEFPILDGSAIQYYKAIEKAGIIKIENAEKDVYIVQKKIEYIDEHSEAKIIILPDEEFSIDVYVDYNSPVVAPQYASLENLKDFGKEIANARTFVFVREIEPLLNMDLIKGGDLDNAIIIYDKTVSQAELDKLSDLLEQPRVKIDDLGIINTTLRYNNELARHKMLDVIGDLSLIGKQIQGKVIAKYPGHKINTAAAKHIRKELKKQEVQAPIYDDSKEPVLDTVAIRKMLPHRWPMQMVDKVIEIREKTIVGVKNVTANETFFMGHFPEEPVMPGVLLVEAMAQTGGLLVTSQLEEPDAYSTYFLKIDNVKFRRKVVPGDTVIFQVTLLDEIRRGVATMKGYAFVGGVIATEAEFMAQIVKNK